VKYASGLSRDPGATYRQIDAAGRTAQADGAALVQLLYEELVAALRAAAWATDHKQFAVKNEKVTRAIAILFALESGLDFDAGGDVARTLATLYTGARKTIIDASVDGGAQTFRDVATSMDEIAAAWRQARNA
jgi:flagellar secretion chaperone FliS